MELKNRSFQYGKVALAVRTQKHQLQFVLKVAAVCTDTVEHATVECRTARSVMFWSKQCHSLMRCCFNFSSGRRRESCYGRRVAGGRPTPHGPWDLGQGYWAATATVRWNLVYCETKTPRCHKNVNNITSLLVTLRAESKLIGIFHIGNFCFWVPFLKQLLLRNCAVDFVEICNVYVGKMIIKAAKRIFHSDKICRSYSDLNFGVTFFGTQCM